MWWYTLKISALRRERVPRQPGRGRGRRGVKVEGRHGWGSMRRGVMEVGVMEGRYDQNCIHI